MTSHYQKLINEAKNGYERYKGLFKALQDSYLLDYGDKKRQRAKELNKAGLYIPKLNAKVKYLIASLNNVYFASERIADLEYYMNSNEKLIKLWQEAIDFYTEKLNIFAVLQPFFMDATLLGTAVAKISWDSKKEGVKIEKIELENIFFDPNARNNEDINYIVNEVFFNEKELLSLQKEGYYSKNVKIKELISEKDYKKIKVYDIYEKKDENWVVSTLLEQTFLRKEVFLNDGLPFVWGSMLPQIRKIDETDDFVCAYGEPIMASALPLQDEINLSRNLLIDASRTHLNPKIVLPKNAGVSRDDLLTIGRPIYTNDVGAFSTLPLPNINSVGANLELLENELTEVTGISPQNNSATAPSNQSATEISIRAEEGGRRAGDYIRQLNESFIEPLFEKFAILVYKYGDNALFEGFARSQMPSFRFNIQTGTGASSKEVRRAGIQSSMGIFSQLYQMYMSMGDAQNAYRIILANEKLIRELLPLLGVKNVNEFLGQEATQMGANQALPQNQPLLNEAPINM